MIRKKWASAVAALAFATSVIVGGALPAQADPGGAPSGAAVLQGVDSGRMTPPIANASNSKVEKGVAKKGLKHRTPPRQGGVSTNAVGTGYHYAYGQNTPAAAQGSVTTNAWVAEPVVGTSDHSIFEITVQAGSGGFTQSQIELGWAVEPVAFAGSADPNAAHLFSSIWVNGTWCGSYVGPGSCGTWVNYNDPAGDVNLGDDLGDYLGAAHVNALNSVKKFAIVYQAGTGCGGTSGWWASYDNKWVGCYKLSIWSGAVPSHNFTTGSFFQAFGEVYKTIPTTGCTQMGNGLKPNTPSSPATAYWNTMTYSATGGPAWTGTVVNATTPTTFGVLKLSDVAGRYGGDEAVTATPC